MGQIGGNDLWLFYALYTENIKLQISDTHTRLCGYMPEILKLVLFGFVFLDSPLLLIFVFLLSLCVAES